MLIVCHWQGFFVGSTLTSVPSEFKNVRPWKSVQDFETCINLTSGPTLILVESKASLYQSLEVNDFAWPVVLRQIILVLLN